MRIQNNFSPRPLSGKNHYLSSHNPKPKIILRQAVLFLSFIVVLPSIVLGQLTDIVVPYNPDFQNDGVVNLPDIMEILQLYGEAFEAESILVGDTSLSSFLEGIVTAINYYSNKVDSLEATLTNLQTNQFSCTDTLFVNVEVEFSDFWGDGYYLLNADHCLIYLYGDNESPTLYYDLDYPSNGNRKVTIVNVSTSNVFGFSGAESLGSLSWVENKLINGFWIAEHY